MFNCHGNNLLSDIELHPTAPLKLWLGEQARPGSLVIVPSLGGRHRGGLSSAQPLAQ